MSEWLSDLDPAPPAELVSSIRKALSDANLDASSSNAADLSRAGEQLLKRVLASDCDKREAALDLLTVDALFTHALEIAARNDPNVEEFAEQMLRRIADLAS